MKSDSRWAHFTFSRRHITYTWNIPESLPLLLLLIISYPGPAEMKIINHRGLLLPIICMLACILCILVDVTSGSIAITPEHLGHLLFPAVLRAPGMSLFALGLYSGRMAALRAASSSSDIRLNRPPINYSFKTNLPHVKEGPIPDVGSAFPVRLGLALRWFLIETIFPSLFPDRTPFRMLFP